MVDVVHLANLALLFANIVELTVEWDNLSSEEKFLEIRNVAQVFPELFLAPESRQGTDEAKVIIELQTQIFVHTFLDAVHTETLDAWNTTDIISKIFKIGGTAQNGDNAHKQVHS